MELFSKRQEATRALGFGLSLAIGVLGVAGCEGGRGATTSSTSSASPIPAESSPIPAAPPSPARSALETCKSTMPAGAHVEIPSDLGFAKIAARLGVTVQQVQAGELVSVACGTSFTPGQMADYQPVTVAGMPQECAIVGQDVTQPGEAVIYEAACPAGGAIIAAFSSGSDRA